jgi:hypothetical protein
VESAPSGASIGCAYFGFIDTDLVKAAYAQPATQLLNKRTPAFLRGPAPLSTAIDAIDRGIERRSARVWAPRWVGAAIALRGLIQPLTERAALRDSSTVAEGMRLADHPDGGGAPAGDPLLGIATEALDETEPALGGR